MELHTVVRKAHPRPPPTTPSACAICVLDVVLAVYFDVGAETPQAFHRTPRRRTKSRRTLREAHGRGRLVVGARPSASLDEASRALIARAEAPPASAPTCYRRFASALYEPARARDAFDAAVPAPRARRVDAARRAGFFDPSAWRSKRRRGSSGTRSVGAARARPAEGVGPAGDDESGGRDSRRRDSGARRKGKVTGRALRLDRAVARARARRRVRRARGARARVRRERPKARGRAKQGWFERWRSDDPAAAKRRPRAAARSRARPRAADPAIEAPNDVDPPTCACCSRAVRCAWIRPRARRRGRVDRRGGRVRAARDAPGGGRRMSGWFGAKTASARRRRERLPAGPRRSRRVGPLETEMSEEDWSNLRACSTSRATRKSRSRRPPRRWTTAWPREFTRRVGRRVRGVRGRRDRALQPSPASSCSNETRRCAPAGARGVPASSPGRAVPAARARTNALAVDAARGREWRQDGTRRGRGFFVLVGAAADAACRRGGAGSARGGARGAGRLWHRRRGRPRLYDDDADVHRRRDSVMVLMVSRRGNSSSSS